MTSEPQDRELNDDELDSIVGGNMGGIIPDHANGVHGGTHYHGKKDQTSGMDDLTDCDCSISF